MNNSNEQLIGVIVPVYNVEKYISKCLDSIIGQSYRYLEVIVVDDGSTDESGQICDNYQKQDERIKVFHIKNSGMGAARNYGLSHTSAELVGFVDGDDWIENDMYRQLLQDMTEDVDITTCGIRDVYDDRFSSAIKGTSLIHGGKKYNTKEAVRELLLGEVFRYSACNKLFRTKLFKDNLFPTGKTGEDMKPVYNAFCRSRAVSNNGRMDYNYYHHDGSITTSEFSLRRMDSLYYAREIKDDVLMKYPDLKEESMITVVRVIEYLTRQIIEENMLENPDGKRAFDELLSVCMEYVERIKNSTMIPGFMRDRLVKLCDAGPGALSVSLERFNSKSMAARNKDKEMLNILAIWMQKRNMGRRIDEYLIERGIQTVAVYGLNVMGDLLYMELRNSDVRACVIDREKDRVASEVESYNVYEGDQLPRLDLIIVTAIFYYDEIEKMLKERVDCPIEAIDDLIMDL